MGKWKSEPAKLVPRGVSECPDCKSWVGASRLCAYCHFVGWYWPTDKPILAAPPARALRHGPYPLVPSDNCPACGQEVAWVVTKNGKNVPLDCIPGQLGPFRVQVLRGVAYFLAPEQAREHVRHAALYSVHFDTCSVL